MHLKRRLNTRRGPQFTARTATAVTAVVAGLSLVAAGAFGGRDIIRTQEIGSGPIQASAASASFGDGATVTVNDSAIKTQGEGDGPKAVKEFHRDEPFSMFAVTWQGQRDIAAFVRAKQPDGSWGSWLPAEPMDVRTDGKNGTDLIFVGDTTDVQVAVHNVDITNPENLEAVFIDGKAQDGIAPVADFMSADMPKVVSRAGWSADESIRCQQPTYNDRTKALTLHHTAGSNNYTQSQAAAQVRGIYQYHAQTLGWCDIGYNVLVDKFGTIYEGRYGGLDRAVEGAHVGGFNTGTWGISMIGNYSETAPSQQMLDSVAEIAGWKAGHNGINPLGQVSLTSGGFGGSKYPAGSVATVPAFHGHNDLHNTQCPGTFTMSNWPQLRSKAAAKATAVSTSGGVGSHLLDGLVDNNPLDPGTGATTPGLNTQPGGTVPSDATSSIGGTEVPVSTITAVVGIAATLAGVFLASNAGGAQGEKVALKDKEVAPGISGQEALGIATKAAALSSDDGTSQSFTSVLNALGPVLGLAVGGPETAGTEQEIIYQLFSNGIILASKETGTHALVGEIAKAWIQNPSSLGLPTTDEYKADGKNIRVDFQGGYITFDPATQKVDVYTK